MGEHDIPFTLAPQRHPHTLPLTFGGELAISEHDGEYRLRIDVDGGHFGIRLTALDVWGIRSLTGDLVRKRANEFAAELESGEAA